jgi:hypothetical protein
MGQRISRNSSVVTSGTRRDCDERFEVACGRRSHCCCAISETHVGKYLKTGLLIAVWVHIVMLTPTIEAISLEARVTLLQKFVLRKPCMTKNVDMWNGICVPSGFCCLWSFILRTSSVVTLLHFTFCMFVQGH